MTTYINLTTPTTRDRVRGEIRDAYRLGDAELYVSINGVPTKAEDWRDSVTIYGNYGELTVALSGQVLLYDRVEGCDHDPVGYSDIIHVELEQFRRRLGHDDITDISNAVIDILQVAYHTADGTFECAVGMPDDDKWYNDEGTLAYFNRYIAGDR